MDVAKQACRIELAAKRLGYRVRESVAQTGSIYLYLETEGGAEFVTVRVSDHGECYPPARRERRLNVDPEGITVAKAIKYLKLGPASIEEYQPAEGPAWQREAWKEQADAEKARKAAHREAWQALRAQLSESDWQKWNRFPSRPTAREIAREHGWSVPVTYSALTNGKNWTRNA